MGIEDTGGAVQPADVGFRVLGVWTKPPGDYMDRSAAQSDYRPPPGTYAKTPLKIHCHWLPIDWSYGGFFYRLPHSTEHQVLPPGKSRDKARSRPVWDRGQPYNAKKAREREAVCRAMQDGTRIVGPTARALRDDARTVSCHRAFIRPRRYPCIWRTVGYGGVQRARGLCRRHFCVRDDTTRAADLVSTCRLRACRPTSSSEKIRQKTMS